jgi:hypothetical protein
MPLSRARKNAFCALVATALLLVVGGQLRWFAREPAYHGRTVTEWLDKLSVYTTDQGVTAHGEPWSKLVPRSSQTVTNDPAFLALMKLGPKAVPILAQRVMDPAGWPRDVGSMSRTRMWIEWRWKQARGAKGLKRPAPSRYSEFQTVRKTTAGFVLLALGTNIHGGFPAYMKAYADAPKHQTIYGTPIAGSPIGVTSSHVARLGNALLPHRRSELLGDILSGMKHSNAWCRTVAVEVSWEFPEEFPKLKDSLLRLTQDESPMVQEAAFGRLQLMFVRYEGEGGMSFIEFESAADVVLQDPKTTQRVRDMAENAKRWAQGRALEPVLR